MPLKRGPPIGHSQYPIAESEGRSPREAASSSLRIRLPTVPIVHTHTIAADVYWYNFSAQRQLRYDRAELVSVFHHDQLQADLRSVGILKGSCPSAIRVDLICTGLSLKSRSCGTSVNHDVIFLRQAPMTVEKCHGYAVLRPADTGRGQKYTRDGLVIGAIE